MMFPFRWKRRIYLPARTVRLRKIHIAQCDGRVLKPSSGEIKIDGQTVEKPSMKYVTIFQNYGLLPWRSVQKNVELGLETKKLGKEEKRRSQIITWKWLA